MAQGVFPGILTVIPYRYPPHLPRMPKGLGVKVAYSKEFPVSGIWLPVSFPNGCPAYFCSGDFATAAKRPAQRIERPPLDATEWTPATPARASYVFEPTPTDWELLWEDHRRTPLSAELRSGQEARRLMTPRSMYRSTSRLPRRMAVSIGTPRARRPAMALASRHPVPRAVPALRLPVKRVTCRSLTRISTGSPFR
jgi:hypothetical protein